jgi:hypothetical protein
VLVRARHTHSGAERASFDPVALESAVYGELYGRRSNEVAPVAQPDGRAGGKPARISDDEQDHAGAARVREPCERSRRRARRPKGSLPAAALRVQARNADQSIMYRALIERVLRRGPTRDEAFDRFASKTAPAAVRAARASAAKRRQSTPPTRRLRSVQPAREQRPAASASRSRRVSLP